MIYPTTSDLYRSASEVYVFFICLPFLLHFIIFTCLTIKANSRPFFPDEGKIKPTSYSYIQKYFFFSTSSAELPSDLWSELLQISSQQQVGGYSYKDYSKTLDLSFILDNLKSISNTDKNNNFHLRGQDLKIFYIGSK
jgi:hypothetical protein